MNMLGKLNKNRKRINTILWGLAVLPIGLVWYQYCYVALINPFDFLIEESGKWALIFFITCYFISPFCRLATLIAKKNRWHRGKRLTDWNFLIFQRRMLGLNSFYYTCVHFFIYFYFEIDLSVEELWLEFTERHFILIGVLALFTLIILAFTSFDYMQRKLKRKWKSVHQLVYLTAVLLMTHILMISKTLTLDIIIYVALCVLLSVERLLHFHRYLMGKRQSDIIRLARNKQK